MKCVAAKPAGNCRSHGAVKSADSHHGRAYAAYLERAAGGQSTIQAFVAAADTEVASGVGPVLASVPVSPIEAGSMSAHARATRTAVAITLRALEHCNLVGLGVNPHQVHCWCRIGVRRVGDDVYTADSRRAEQGHGVGTCACRTVMNRDISTADFWSSMRKSGRYNELCEVADYWTSFETSSIVVERAFAMLRMMEMPSRSRQLPRTWAPELRFRFMRRTIEALVLRATDNYAATGGRGAEVGAK